MKKIIEQESGKIFFYTINKEGKSKKHSILNSNFQLLTSKSGITLISLVVTIVVLLILAGITINLVLAEEGLFERAQGASEAQKKAEARESVELMLADYSIEKATKNKDLEEYLNEQKEAKNLDEVINNGDGTITVEKNGYEVTININTLKIESIVKNVRAVRIIIDKTTVKPNEEATATIEIVGEEIEKVLKWEYTEESDKIGVAESSYTYNYTSNEIKLVQGIEGTYYLHLLVEDKNGDPEEKISRPIKVMKNPVTSITLDKTELTINNGETYTLIATVKPDNADDTRVNWTSSDETVATIDETGKITTLKGGNTTITATAADGSGVEASCEVTVVQKATGITLSETTATIYEGDILTLTATITPEDTTNKAVTWTSSDEEVATVSTENGSLGVAITVTGIKAGTATITVEVADGSEKSASCKVVVESDWATLSKIAKEISDNSSTITKSSSVATVTVEGTSYTLNVGDTYKVINNGQLKTVRIMGFNHDKLTNTNAYEGNNTYAGISFEFVDLLVINGKTNSTMNSTNTNSGGWGVAALRTTLNSTAVLNSLSNNTYIKQVSKKYIATYNSASSVTTSNDKLWLLATSEIWNNGYSTGYYGFAVTNESTMYDSNDTQTQYKYYADKLGSTGYRVETNIIKKPSATGSTSWRLRSPYYKGSRFLLRCSLSWEMRCNVFKFTGLFGSGILYLKTKACKTNYLNTHETALKSCFVRILEI